MLGLLGALGLGVFGIRELQKFTFVEFRIISYLPLGSQSCRPILFRRVCDFGCLDSDGYRTLKNSIRTFRTPQAKYSSLLRLISQGKL